MQRAFTLAVVLAYSVPVASLLGDERPRYQNIRFREDWSEVHEASESDAFDPIKRIDIADDGAFWLGFGGQARTRIEAWNRLGFGAAGGDSDDVFGIHKLRYHADLHATEHLRVFVEGKSSFATDRDLPGGRRNTDVDELALQNAFVDWTLPAGSRGALTLRAGRRELLFGGQRLISPRDWSNTCLTWDGGSLIWRAPWYQLTGFWAVRVPGEKYDFNSSDPGTQLYGLYGTGTHEWLTLDSYFLGLTNDDAVVSGTAGHEDRFTLGGRTLVKIPKTAVDVDVEGAYQWGEVGNGQVDALMIGSEVRYTFALDYKPQVSLGFDYGSGDRSPDGGVQTWNHLFPSGRRILGYMNLVGRQNVASAFAGGVLQPLDPLTTYLRWHFFWRASRRDGLYNAGGRLVRDGALGNSREIGSEMDLSLKWQFDRHFFTLLGYSHFFAGDFVRESGKGDDVDFGYLLLQYTF